MRRKRVDAEAEAARERARGPGATVTELRTLVATLSDQNKTLQAKLSLGQVWPRSHRCQQCQPHACGLPTYSPALGAVWTSCQAML